MQCIAFIRVGTPTKEGSDQDKNARSDLLLRCGVPTVYPPKYDYLSGLIQYMKLLLLSIISFFAVNTIQAQNTNTPTPTKWLTYLDSGFRFTVQYPSDWEFKKPNTNTRFFITSYKENETDNFRENINCIARRLEQQNFTIKMAEEAIKTSLAEKLTNYHLIKSAYIQWNNAETLELEYTCKQSAEGVEYDIHMLQRMAVIKGTLFTLTFTSETQVYDKYIATVRKVYNSLKVK